MLTETDVNPILIFWNLDEDPIASRLAQKELSFETRSLPKSPTYIQSKVLKNDVDLDLWIHRGLDFRIRFNGLYLHT